MAVLLSATAPAAAQDDISAGSFGVGLQLGYPGNGLSFNYFTTEAHSVQAGLSVWSHSDSASIATRADYLFWQAPIASPEFADVLWYFGPGASLFLSSLDRKGKDKDELGVGFEFPVGIGFRFVKVPIDLNLEAVPIFGFLGNDAFNIGLAIAGVLDARYYF